MSTRKTTSERIDLHKEKMEQMQNEMKRLKRLHNAEERKKRNHRICTRGAHIESLLPDSIILSDERFFAFLEKTVANDFGRRALAALVAEQQKEDAANAAAEAEENGEASASITDAATQNANETAKPKPAQTPSAQGVADGNKTENGVRQVG